MNRRLVLSAALVGAAAVVSPTTAGAQGALPATSPAAPGAAGQPVLPPVPPAGLEVTSIEVKGFRFEGNKVFSNADLQKVVAPYVGPGKTLEDLDAARTAVTLLYVNNGYINSGAVLPDQTIDPSDGIVTLQIVEGRLTELHIEGLDGKKQPFRENYVRARIERANTPALNRNQLAEQLELIRLNPAVKRMVAELRPGALPGQAALELKIAPEPPVKWAVEFANDRPPSVGPLRLSTTVSDLNLTGNGDVLDVDWTLLRGDFGDPSLNMEWAGLDSYSVRYALPLNASGTLLSLYFGQTDEPVVQDEFAGLGISTRTRTAELLVKQPIWRTPNEELTLGVGAVWRESESKLLGESFDFTSGSRDGTSSVAALQFVQEYFKRGIGSALAARSTFAVGLDTLGATALGGDEPDGQYLAWIGQMQYVRRLRENSNARVVVRGVSQIAFDELLALQQFSIGGSSSVRGYRENRLVRDSGAWGGVELRLPLLPYESRSTLELVPFVDGGYAWNADSEQDGLGLLSVGAGLVFAPTEWFETSVFYGYGLMNRDRGDLQDIGIHFAVTIRPLH
jgi:hemolysin activation/secretion protein